MSYGSNGLSFNTLRAANLKRLPLFKNNIGEVVHPPPYEDGSNWSLSDWMTAVTGEVGEAANNIKKILREDYTLEEMQGKLADEFADIVIYLDILAYRANIDLGLAVAQKWNFVSHRIGVPIVIGPDDDWHYTENQNAPSNS